jgi:cytochrome c biogenesis protein
VKEDAENHFREGLDEDAFLRSLTKKRFHIEHTENGFRASKHRIGNIGSSVTHLGIIIIILGSFFGNLFAEEGFFYLIPGESKNLESHDFSLRLDDFSLSFREDGSIEQYTSEMTVFEGTKEIKKDTMWVNNPLSYNGINLYQTSYGWTSRLTVRDEQGAEVYTGLLKNNETYFYEPLHLTIYLYGFFPNMNVDPSGLPFTMTDQVENPYYAVILYLMNDQVGAYVLEPGQPILYEGLSISVDDSVLYTGITYRKEFGFFFVLLGSLLLLLGLILSFYFYPKYIFGQEKSIRGAAKQNLWGLNILINKMIKEADRRK